VEVAADAAWQPGGALRGRPGPVEVAAYARLRRKHVTPSAAAITPAGIMAESGIGWQIGGRGWEMYGRGDSWAELDVAGLRRVPCCANGPINQSSMS